MGLFLSLPLWPIIMTFIYLEDGWPIVFLQERIGKEGREFKLIKFRTMRHDPAKLHLDIDLANDPRVTRVGRFLRLTAFDELPQLINIVKGDMSFVGPRALPMVIDDEEKIKYARLDQLPNFKARCQIKPGLTGLSQIYAPRNANREEKFKYDLEYINKMNLMLDLKLIGLSFWKTFNGAWEEYNKEK